MDNQTEHIYQVPMVDVVEIKAKNIICSSPNGGTEGFTVNDNYYTDDDWE